jgi:hypothetical protein
VDDPGLQLDAPVIDDFPVVDAAPDADWAQHVVDDHQPTPDDPGFDDLI